MQSRTCLLGRADVANVAMCYQEEEKEKKKKKKKKQALHRRSGT